MREVLDKAELHARFLRELRAHPDAAASEFVFEIDFKPEGPGGCNWFPLASIEAWRGDLMSNLRIFGEVRARMSARYNVAQTDTADASARTVSG